jgi:hypothetical protein
VGGGGGGGGFYKLWEVQHIIEACSPSPFQFTADVRYEKTKKFEYDDKTDNVFGRSNSLHFRNICQKRNCFRSGSAKNIVDV